MTKVRMKPRKIVVAAKAKKEESVKVRSAKPTKSVESVARVSAPRFQHDINVVYAGVSPSLNARKSRTPLRSEEFGAAPELVMSERDNSVLRPLKERYGKKDFQRGNVDTGILNRAIRKGIVRHVSGDPTHETATLRFV